MVLTNCFLKQRPGLVQRHDIVTMSSNSYKLRKLAHPMTKQGYRKTHALLKINQPGFHGQSYQRSTFTHNLDTVQRKTSCTDRLIHLHSVFCQSFRVRQISCNAEPLTFCHLVSAIEFQVGNELTVWKDRKGQGQWSSADPARGMVTYHLTQCQRQWKRIPQGNRVYIQSDTNHKAPLAV